MSVKNPTLWSTGQPVTVSALSLTMPVDDLPTARLSTPDDVKMHDFVEIFTAQGSAGVFRVTDRAQTFGGLAECSLKGALDTLSDDLYAGTADITGTISAALTAILNQQTVPRWQLGNVCSAKTVKIANSYTDLLSLVNSVKSEVPSSRWVFDYTTTPWTLSLAQLDSTVVSEFRVGRNIESATVDMSDAEMCTKLYMTVSTSSNSTLHVYENATAQSEWGVICKTADVKAENCPDADAYGAQILAERAQPVAFITIDGEDLRAITGDDFDRITLGSHCRVILEDYAGRIDEVVTKIEWPDPIGEPNRIKVSLANNLKPFTEQLNLMKRTGAGTARKVEDQSKELVRHRADIDKDNERILLWATEEEWDEIAEEWEETGKSQLEITSAQIASKVSNSTYQSYIQQTANKIALVVGGTDANPTVNTASIIASINAQTGQSHALIEADQIDINGIVSALTAKNVEVSHFVAANAEIGDCEIDVDGNIFALSCTASSFPVTNGANLINSHVGVTQSESNGQITLTFAKADGGTPDTVTFSRAASSVTLSGVWSGGNTFTVTPSPQSAGNPLVETLLYTITPTPSGGSSSATIDNFNSSTHRAALAIGSNNVSGGVVKQFVIDASDVFDAGYDEGELDMLDLYTVVSVAKNSSGTITASGANITIPLSIEIGDDLSGNTKTVSGKSVTTSASTVLETATAQLTNTAHQMTPSSGKLGFTSVTIPAAALKDETFTSNGTYTVPSGYYGYGTITVSTYPNSASLTRTRAGQTEQIIPGYLYRYENGSYTRLGSSSTYWYQSSTNIGSTATVHYN